MVIFRRWKLVIVLAVLFSMTFFSWYFVFGFSSNHHGSHFNKGLNAAWIGHRWVENNVKEQEIIDLVNNFKDLEIKYVFVHTGPIEENGTIPSARYPGARDFIHTAKQIDESVVYQAWIGQLRSKLDLSKGSSRKNIANMAHKLIHDIGFDGVHLNIEPTFDGDTEFIFLAKEIRERIGTIPLFSVAIGELIPKKVTSFLEFFADEDNRVFGYRVDKDYNTAEFYQALAKYVDQFAVMSYDTSIKDSELFKWFVAQQVIYVTRAVPDRQVFIGVPTYEDVRPNFDVRVENMATGLLGVTNGLNNFRSKLDAFTGVAIYSYWETDRNEWSLYKDLWLGTPQNPES